MLRWSMNTMDRALAGFVVTLHFHVDFSAATLASGGNVTIDPSNRSSFTFDMDATIDALILR